jgi:hypothetical protein
MHKFYSFSTQTSTPNPKKNPPNFEANWWKVQKQICEGVMGGGWEEGFD